MIHEVRGRCRPVRSTCEGQSSAGNRRVCRWPSAIRMESSPLRSHGFHNRPREKMLCWSLWHEIEAHSICPLGPAWRIALQGHCNTAECNIPSLSSDGLEWITWHHSKHILEPFTPQQTRIHTTKRWNKTCITFLKNLFNGSLARGQTVVLFC